MSLFFIVYSWIPSGQALYKGISSHGVINMWSVWAFCIRRVLPKFVRGLILSHIEFFIAILICLRMRLKFTLKILVLFYLCFIVLCWKTQCFWGLNLRTHVTGYLPNHNTYLVFSTRTLANAIDIHRNVFIPNWLSCSNRLSIYKKVLVF